MKANELRIGNLVYGYKTVWSIDSTDFCNIGVIETYKPIPITEEWLLKFGFTPIDFNEGLAKNHVIIYRPDFKDSYEYHGWHYVYESDYMQRTTIIEYVHQLQNIYFALIGEELELK